MKELGREFEESNETDKIINTTNIKSTLAEKIEEMQENFVEKEKEHKLSKESDNSMGVGTRIWMPD